MLQKANRKDGLRAQLSFFPVFQMESLELENRKEESTKEIQADQLSISEDIPSNKGITGEPTALARVGDEYQAQVPDPAIAYNTEIRMAPDIPFIWATHGSEEVNIPLPGMHTSSPWSESEKEIFLLGMYVFGKRLNLLRRFLEGENKTMGDVLSYYYGNFYKSDWYLKYKMKRCVLGSRIFQGWRQDQIFSRLTGLMPNESHDALQEAFKSYNEERSSFEDFIFALKGVTGVHNLVEAVSIGKGKHDLTKVRSDPSKGKIQSQAHMEMPVGKEWSSLSLEEVIRFLTGGFRLGKSRSNDLFWEAVWPRLLVKGWISVQPKDHALIFLIPGIDSFPREDLVKGIHYFDSVTDLLSKVASDPNMISVPSNGADNVETNAENSSNSLCPKLQFPNSELSLMKFTVIDTSIVEGEVPCKIRALRSLPLHTFTATRDLLDKPEVDMSAPEGSDRSNSLNKSINLEKDEPFEINLAEKNSLEDAKLKSKKRVYVDNATTLSKRRRLGLSKAKIETCENDQNTPPCIDELSLRSQFPEPEVEAKGMAPEVEAKNTPQATQPSIDLNLPDLTSPSDESNEKVGANSNNSRRHGTRNRPPTAKALESLALGFLGTTKRKDSEIKSSRNRPTRRARKSVETVISGPHEGVSIGACVSPCAFTEDLIDQV
ncbi:arginine-glutamic acid dipeptide repeat protein [Rhynchospora pubera]|uniref:Arginine-glutamic acid dipeptide repeat protein n=1 Tax=Rhynchospora pubera TaxID=906938 RepID=A0AAV8E9L0_9POAL|nr:arginine-glutamic acid dipeptide repeat protein [Rhynchospora pubera]